MTHPRPGTDLAPTRPAHDPRPTDVAAPGTTGVGTTGLRRRPIAAPLTQTAAVATAAVVVEGLVALNQAVTHAGPGLTIPLLWVLLLVTLVGVGTLTRAASPLTVRPLPRIGWAVVVVALGWTASLAVHVALRRYADGLLSGSLVELWLGALAFGVVAAVLSAHRVLMLGAVALIVAASAVVMLLGPGDVPPPPDAAVAAAAASTTR